MAESVHFRNFFSKKIYLPKSFILTKSAAETGHEKILTAEIAHFLKFWHVVETVFFVAGTVHLKKFSRNKIDWPKMLIKKF